MSGVFECSYDCSTVIMREIELSRTAGRNVVVDDPIYFATEWLDARVCGRLHRATGIAVFDWCYRELERIDRLGEFVSEL